jgi:hypothetical protein
MKHLAAVVAAGVLAVMLTVTTWASMRQAIWNVGDEYWGNPWAVATLADAYCGFLIFYLWIAYKEVSAPRRILWFALVMLLGNIATAAYLLIQAARLKPGEGLETLLLARRRS